MDLAETIYLRKRRGEQAFWDYAKVSLVPIPLKFLVTQDRVFVGPETALRVMEYFHGLGFRNDEVGNLRTPVEITDYDGNPVSIGAAPEHA